MVRITVIENRVFNPFENSMGRFGMSFDRIIRTNKT